MGLFRAGFSSTLIAGMATGDSISVQNLLRVCFCKTLWEVGSVIKSLYHVALNATDGEKTAKFYTELLGFKETHRLEVPGAGNLIFVALGDGTEIEIFSDAKPLAEGETAWEDPKVGFKHICLLVDDVEAETRRLKAAGVKFCMDPQEVVGLRISFLKDPDGNIVELLQRLD